MCKLFKFKAKKRLTNWKYFRKRRLAMEEEKRQIREKLMERYDIPEKIHETFWAYRSDDQWYSYEDDENNSLSPKEDDIIPMYRRGDLIFFYKVTGIRVKYGDYGWSDYASFPTLKYNHYEKIPHKVVDPKRSLKIKWEVLSVEDGVRRIAGYVQGIRIVNVESTKEKGSRQVRVEARYINNNFTGRGYGDLPSYYDHYWTLAEAKKGIQDKVNKLVREKDVVIEQKYIPHKISRKNR